MKFEDLFKKATSIEHFPFQKRFAEALPSLVRIPTGLGKTALAVIGWLWRRRYADEKIREATPRRLVYCLPMRVLVEQTYENVLQWLKNSRNEDVKVYVLMGGEEEEDWTLYPEQDVILIGTQDMLLSRALNRGYAMSRYRWPVAFGLLNNDCLWVMDEVQLMDTGLATSTQLDGFRKKLVTFNQTQSIWMSATLETSWMNTVDCNEEIFNPQSFLELTQEDYENPTVDSRWNAKKSLRKMNAEMGDVKKITEEVIDKHQPGSLTLVIVNTVSRAQEIYTQIKKNKSVNAEIVLLHSRYRPPDRAKIMEQVVSSFSEHGRILISTQVVEAGIDLSAKTLFTELAPWPSMVQRFGRCNRQGEFNEDLSAGVYWIDLPEEEKDRKKVAPPYEIVELIAARTLLNKLENAGPSSLLSLREQCSEEYQSAMGMDIEHVLRKRDLIDLFDTTPDLAGADIDISRFIRSGDEHDVQVFWRNLAQGGEPDPSHLSGSKPIRNELCTVSVSRFREFAKNYRYDFWRWDALTEKWQRIDTGAIYPGQTFLIRSTAGGYSENLGWIGNEKKPEPVEPILSIFEKVEGYDSDKWSIKKTWQSIELHTNQVIEELKFIQSNQHFLPENLKDDVFKAIRWHDIGKAHPVFQNAIQDGDGENEHPSRPSEWKNRTDIAKAPYGFWKPYTRTHFRHELASALAMMQAGLPDLSVYLTAAHHGKVRLSIRSFPNEKTPEDPHRLFARGIHDGDSIPETNLGGGIIAPETQLSLQCMQLGRSEDGSPSWVERMLRLRDELGPFRLAFLEAVVRAADRRASAKAETPKEVNL